MAHLHSIYDTDKHFTIDPITRDITNKSSKVTLMQYDHNSERFTFEIPKMIEGHDMTLCNCVRIHFINIGNTKTNKSEGVYEVDDIQISPDSEDVIIFSWLIKRSATEYNGSLNFAIRFYCIAEDSTVDYSWGTNIFSGIKVSNGLDNSDVIVEDYIDVLEKWKNDVLSSIPPETIRKIESLDLNNMLILRDLDSGTYVLYGKFKPYPEADSTMSFSSDILVNIIRRTNDSQVQIFYPYNNCVQYLKITDTSYERTNVYLNDLATTEYVDEAISNISQVPSSTIDDNDKFLRVVDGVATWTTTPNDAIQYSEQALTEEQKQQARINIGAGKPQVQADWNQNDTTAADYVKNRPFYTGDPVETVLLDETEIEFSPVSEHLYVAELSNIDFNFEIGATYKVTWDGILYECIAYNIEGLGAIGSQYIITGSSDTGEPFFAAVSPDTGLIIYTHDSSASHTVSISADFAEIVKIDDKYIPELPYMTQTNPTGSGSFSLNRKAGTTIGYRSFAYGENTTASGSNSHASGSGTEATGNESTATGFYTKATAVASSSFGGDTEANGRFSHAEGDGSVVSSVDRDLQSKADENGMGYCGHAEGFCTLVTGKYASHAEGYKTKASGNTSHAEGRETVASGFNSHAEGYSTTASGSNSHAECHTTTASGNYSHAEGYGTTASGDTSHAEGYDTTASGDTSHAEGCGTKASSKYQHVQGKYNIEDTNNVYADIVGNGTSSVSRSNAYTLDWNGNGWFAGDVYVGGTSQNNATKLATVPKITNISIPAASWTGAEAPYSQVVTVNGVTVNSKVDLQPTATQIIALQDANIMLMTENNDGVVTVYAIGGIPTSDYTMQALITEVVVV